MSALLTTVLVVLAAVVATPALLLLLEVLAAPRRFPEAGPPRAQAPRGRVAVLVPAHNEAAGITATLRNLRTQLRSGDRLLVVADNCSDDTAALAAQAGAEVVTRQHESQRGKGYALDHGVRHLETWHPAPDVVVIVDADCTLGAHALDHLAVAVTASGRPVQARYLMHAPPGATLKVSIAEFAWVVKNAVRPAGLARAGLPCHLNGSGMAFPWALLRGAPLANGHLVEDMKLGLDLAAAGRPPLYCASAVVHSEFPSQEAGLQSQRRRWEQGHLGVIVDQGLGNLWRGAGRLDLRLMAMAVDTCIPPLASLVLLQGACALFSLVYAGFTGAWLPALLALAGLLGVALAVLLAWQGHGRHLLAVGDLLAVPAYILDKLPIYLAAVLGRRTGWVRTQRDHEAATSASVTVPDACPPVATTVTAATSAESRSVRPEP